MFEASDFGYVSSQFMNYVCARDTATDSFGCPCEDSCDSSSEDCPCEGSCDNYYCACDGSDYDY